MSSIEITEELGRNFLTYALDVDNNKAFPSVYDGLLPGARAALWEMYTQKYTSNKPHVKSAKVASGVIGNWWPHNADATYGTLVRMAQPFVENCLEIDFQGAVGNAILGQDSAGSSRYTEMRLSTLAEEGILRDVDKENCDMIWNYTQDKKWPKVFPSVFPRLLVNGSIGLGVGVSQVWTLHSLRETAKLIIDYINDGELDEDNYFPDFPTGGIIVNKDELSQINKTGKGRIIVEAEYESYPKEHKIVFTEFPYQVYIEELINSIKEEYNKEKITTISDVFNSSAKDNISITVFVNPAYTNEQCLDELFQYTSLRKQYNINQNAIVDKAPELLTLRQVVDYYIDHNTKCIKRSHEYDYNSTCARIEILEGLLLAIKNLDQVINIIRNGDNPKEELMNIFSLSENQVKAILDMRLAKLSKLENDKLEQELKEKKEFAEYCDSVIKNEAKQKEILVERLFNLAEKYGDDRRTQVIQKTITKKEKTTKTKQEEIPQDIVVTLDSLGYMKCIPVAQYRKNKAMLQSEFKCQTTDLILIFTNKGKYYRINYKDVGLCGPTDKGKALGSVLKMEPGEKVLKAFSSIYNEKHPYIMTVTNNGLIKKTEKLEFLGASTRNLNGQVYCGLNKNEVLYVNESNGDIVSIGTHNGYCISFKMDEVRPTGKTSRGIKAINIQDGDKVNLVALNNMPPKSILQNRGGKGKKIW